MIDNYLVLSETMINDYLTKIFVLTLPLTNRLRQQALSAIFQQRYIYTIMEAEGLVHYKPGLTTILFEMSIPNQDYYGENAHNIFLYQTRTIMVTMHIICCNLGKLLYIVSLEMYAGRLFDLCKKP